MPAKPVAPGQDFSGVPRLAQLLRLLGDLRTDQAAPVGNTYAGPLIEAVTNYQVRHGMQPTGRLDVKTVQELNVPLKTRVRQIELTLERWRWLPHSYPQPPVVANLPEFRVRAMDEGGKVSFYENVIVGKAYGHKSPVFEKEMRHVIFRPYWDVTPTIQRAEIIPHIQKDRGYISKKDFEVVTPDGKVVTDGVIGDEVLAQLQAGPLRSDKSPDRQIHWAW